MYLEQGGVMGGALGGIVPTGMSLALIAAQGTLGYIAINVLLPGFAAQKQ